jgi:hypothetical protein
MADNPRFRPPGGGAVAVVSLLIAALGILLLLSVTVPANAVDLDEMTVVTVAPETAELTWQRRCPEAPESDVGTLTLTLLAWIVAKTGLTEPEPPPVSFAPEHQMTHLFDAAAYRDRQPQADVPANQGAGGVHSGFRVQAFYVHATATVYLPETWRPGGLRDQSVLLHELVHHVQRFNKVVPVCPAALERQAYELQATWLREQGVAEPYKLIGTDEFTVLMRSACMPPDW